MIINISEIQKNLNIFRNVTETIFIMNKENKEVLAMVLPKKNIDKNSLTDSLGGILQRKNNTIVKDLDNAITKAYEEEMNEKYGK
jgi:hypothetical protein